MPAVQGAKGGEVRITDINKSTISLSPRPESRPLVVDQQEDKPRTRTYKNRLSHQQQPDLSRQSVHSKASQKSRSPSKPALSSSHWTSIMAPKPIDRYVYELHASNMLVRISERDTVSGTQLVYHLKPAAIKMLFNFDPKVHRGRRFDGGLSEDELNRETEDYYSSYRNFKMPSYNEASKEMEDFWVAIFSSLVSQ